MRNKLLLLLLLMFMTSGMMYAQQQKTQQSQQRTAAPSYTLKGVLLDSLTQEGEPYATIKIAKKNAPQKALKMAVTDLNGKFQEKLTVAPGEYIITLSSVGKVTIVKDFTVKASEKVIDLGKLNMADPPLRALSSPTRDPAPRNPRNRAAYRDAVPLRAPRARSP